MYRKIIVFTIFLFMVAGCSKTKQEHAVISFMVGDVKKNNVEAHIGDVINKDDVIKTAENSFCDVKIGSSLLRVKAKSNLVFSSLMDKKGNENTVLGLKMGKMLCKPKKLLKDEKFMIKTPTAVASVRGTQFSVETDKLKTSRIKVFSGKVRVAKRVKALESKVNEVLDLATGLQKEEKVVITAKEVEKAEKAVEKAIKLGKSKGNYESEILNQVVKQNYKKVVIGKNEATKFAATDFQRENKEIIDVTEKPKKVIAKLKRVIKKTLDDTATMGRLVVTEYDIYFVKSGKILWAGSLVGKPVRQGSKLYVSSEDYVFCAEESGPVLWKQDIINDGQIKVSGGKVQVRSGNDNIKLDARTGKRL